MCFLDCSFFWEFHANAKPKFLASQCLCKKNFLGKSHGNNNEEKNHFAILSNIKISFKFFYIIIVPLLLTNKLLIDFFAYFY